MRWNFPRRAAVWHGWMKTLPVSVATGRTTGKILRAFFENLADVTKKFGPPDTIIVGLGPGSYAGTRIAISAAIGLQVSSGARLIGFPSICAMESNAEEYSVIGDARRKSFFFARIRANNMVQGSNAFLGVRAEIETRHYRDHNASFYLGFASAI